MMKTFFLPGMVTSRGVASCQAAHLIIAQVKFEQVPKGIKTITPTQKQRLIMMHITQYLDVELFPWSYIVL